MKKVVISGMIGNALEWYDYALYAQFSYLIGQHFFPKTEFIEILTFAVFAAGFIIRPVGGILFGYIGDKFGRKTALILGILLMAVPTAGIGLLPTYNSIGIAAPIILVVIRLLQGLSLGGEFSGCIAYLVEHASLEHRGLVGSSSFVSMCLGMILGLLVAQGFTWALTPEALTSWGWRVPFIAGLFIGGIGLYIRTHLKESPVYQAAKEKGLLSATPLRLTITQYWPQILMAVMIYVNVTAPFYTITVFIKNYMHTLGYNQQESIVTCILILVSMTVTFPISAYYSDKIGRKPILILGSCLLIIAIYPVFLALHTMNYMLATLSQIVFSVIVGIYMGPVPTLLVELFPTKVRFTGVAVSYNLSAAIFGGTAPMVGAILYKLTGEQISIAYYLIILGVIGLSSLYFYRETYKNEL